MGYLVTNIYNTESSQFSLMASLMFFITYGQKTQSMHGSTIWAVWDRFDSWYMDLYDCLLLYILKNVLLVAVDKALYIHTPRCGLTLSQCI